MRAQGIIPGVSASIRAIRCAKGRRLPVLVAPPPPFSSFVPTCQRAHSLKSARIIFAPTTSPPLPSLPATGRRPAECAPLGCGTS